MTVKNDCKKLMEVEIENRRDSMSKKPKKTSITYSINLSFVDKKDICWLKAWELHGQIFNLGKFMGKSMGMGHMWETGRSDERLLEKSRREMALAWREVSVRMGRRRWNRGHSRSKTCRLESDWKQRLQRAGSHSSLCVAAIVNGGDVSRSHAFAVTLCVDVCLLHQNVLRDC